MTAHYLIRDQDGSLTIYNSLANKDIVFMNEYNKVNVIKEIKD